MKAFVFQFVVVPCTSTPSTESRFAAECRSWGGCPKVSFPKSDFGYEASLSNPSADFALIAQDEAVQKAVQDAVLPHLVQAAATSPDLRFCMVEAGTVVYPHLVPEAFVLQFTQDDLDEYRKANPPTTPASTDGGETLPQNPVSENSASTDGGEKLMTLEEAKAAFPNITDEELAKLNLAPPHIGVWDVKYLNSLYAVGGCSTCGNSSYRVYAIGWQPPVIFEFGASEYPKQDLTALSQNADLKKRVADFYGNAVQELYKAGTRLPFLDDTAVPVEVTDRNQFALSLPVEVSS